MESYYDPQEWLVPSNTPYEKEVRKANPDFGQKIEPPEKPKELEENEGLYGTGKIVPMKIKPRRPKDVDFELEAAIRKHKLIRARNTNMHQNHSFTETIGQRKAAYYRGLESKGLGERHPRPVPGHPTVKFLGGRPEASEDEIALRNLMAKTMGNHGVISSFVPTHKPKPRKTDENRYEYLLELNNPNRRTLTPIYHARKTHFILGGSESSKPTTALTSSTN